jgi:hypothetical protein
MADDTGIVGMRKEKEIKAVFSILFMAALLDINRARVKFVGEADLGDGRLAVRLHSCWFRFMLLQVT